MTTSQRPSLVLAIVLCTAGLGCEQPLAPLLPDPSREVVASVAGHVIDADTGQPVAGAVVTVVSVSAPRFQISSNTGLGTRAVADGAGAFRLEHLVREDWLSMGLNVARDGYEPRGGRVESAASDALALEMYPTLTLRRGESIQTRVRLRSYNCVDFDAQDGYPCRRVAIESAPGESVEVELVPPTGPDNGLELDAQRFSFEGYTRHVTVTSDAVWIIGGSSPVTLTARRP
jgi:hypothetical protein